MKMDIVCFVGLFGLITGCGSPVRPPLTAEASAQQALIVNAEAKAQPPARQALSTLRQMVNRGEIIPGGCWGLFGMPVLIAPGFPKRGGRWFFQVMRKQVLMPIRRFFCRATGFIM